MHQIQICTEDSSASSTTFIRELYERIGSKVKPVRRSVRAPMQDSTAGEATAGGLLQASEGVLQRCRHFWILECTSA